MPEENLQLGQAIRDACAAAHEIARRAMVIEMACATGDPESIREQLILGPIAQIARDIIAGTNEINSLLLPDTVPAGVRQLLQEKRERMLSPATRRARKKARKKG